MDLKETSNLQDEENHWWIKTRFIYLNRALGVLKKNILNNDGYKILEIGSGTGINLKFIKEKSLLKDEKLEIVGYDKSRKKVFSKEGPYDMIIFMDVLEHLDDDLKTLDKYLNLLNNNGGVLFITVPTLNFLWSYHDEFLGHKRRYCKNDLVNIGNKLKLSPISISYFFGHLVGPIYFYRKLSPFFRKQKIKSDLFSFPKILNTISYYLCILESKMGGNQWLGTSAQVIFLKKR